MTTTTHFAADEVMAWVDGELAAGEALAVAAHVDECVECAAVAAQFRRLSEEMAAWKVEEVPARVEEAVLAEGEGASEYPHGRRKGRRTWGTRGLWLGGALAAAAVLLVAVSPRSHQPGPMYEMAPQPQTEALMESRRAMSDVASSVRADAPPASEARLRVPSPMQAARAQMSENLVATKSVSASRTASQVEQATPPMIARTVKLQVRVKEVEQARGPVEAIVARHGGYMAEMNAVTAETSPRIYSASLRIPAAELEAALKELRTLGPLLSETQAGEEVTQQHQDLEARLKNSRETEGRLQAILQQRTGRISDVLEVEQEIARVRGEIESMEAEQAGLEHRVEFASVDVTLMEAERIGGPESVGTRMGRALTDGYRSAGETVVGMVVFAEEYGPSLAVWGVVLGLPGWWVWRRWRRTMRVGVRSR
jgi:hypothetical protein